MTMFASMPPLPIARRCGESTHDLEPLLDGRPVRDAVKWQEGPTGWVEVYVIDPLTLEVERDIFDRPKTKRMNGAVSTRPIQY